MCLGIDDRIPLPDAPEVLRDIETRDAGMELFLRELKRLRRFSEIVVDRRLGILCGLCCVAVVSAEVSWDGPEDDALLDRA